MILKKIISSILAGSMIFACGAVPAFAQGSITDVVEIVRVYDENEAEVSYEVSDIAPEIPVLTEEKAASLIDGATADELSVLWQKDVKVEAAPATIEFSVAGIDDDTEVYVFHYVDEEWKLEASGKGKSINAKFDSFSPIAVAVKNASAIQKTDSNPETGDKQNALLWGGLMLIAICGAAGTIYYAKRREKAN